MTSPSLYASVGDLPEALQSALRQVSYHKKDIGLSSAEKISIRDCGGDGRRGFVILVNLTTNEQEIHWGSWGGSNMFNPSNSVDLDDNEYVIPKDGAVIRGSISGGPTYATITLHPDNLVKLLPSKVELSEKERGILNAYGSLKSGPYRKEELHRLRATDADVDALVGKGLLKRTKVGVSITTEGKNHR